MSVSLAEKKAGQTSKGLLYCLVLPESCAAVYGEEVVCF